MLLTVVWRKANLHRQRERHETNSNKTDSRTSNDISRTDPIKGGKTFSRDMKNTLDGGKIVRSKSAKDASVIEFNKLHNGKQSVFNACIGRPLSEVNVKSLCSQNVFQLMSYRRLELLLGLTNFAVVLSRTFVPMKTRGLRGLNIPSS